MRGIFISFEGGDGGGKTTQIERLAQRLGEAGLRVRTTREPGGTPAGEQIRNLLQSAREGAHLHPEAELLLFAASRAQLVREVIEPALAAGECVLADRFLDSTTVYQGVARRLRREDVAAINDFAVGKTRPDITFVFDLCPSLARERLTARSGEERDRIESQPLAFFEAVRAGYLELARQEPERVHVVDASQPVEAVHQAIWAIIEEKFHGILA